MHLNKYEPGNIRWADATTQARNRSIVVEVTINGITKPLADWADEYGLPPKCVYQRIRHYGFSIEDALTTPKNYRYKYKPRS